MTSGSTVDTKVRRSKNKPWHQSAVAALTERSPRVFTRTALALILEEELMRGSLPPRTSLNAFINALEEHGQLRLQEVPAVWDREVNEEEPRYPPFRRYMWGAPSPLEVALSLRPRSYLSHASAMRANGLDPNSDRSTYVNSEQSPKQRSSGVLQQAAIDRAFQNLPRKSKYIFRYKGTEIVMVSGKNTNRLGVVEIEVEAGIRCSVTQLERTLIDIAVRPSYAGGVQAVLDAFKQALPRVSVGTLEKTLRELDYVYPYHQSIGFYLERAGATPEQTAPFRAFGLAHDFYLAHRMENPVRNADWRVYHPPHFR